jgi:hypothetical protein
VYKLYNINAIQKKYKNKNPTTFKASNPWYIIKRYISYKSLW